MEPLFTVQKIKDLLGAESFGYVGNGASEIQSVVIDSRAAVPKSLFVPLRGSRTDGHLYIGESFHRGCRAALVERSFWSANMEGLKRYAAQYNAVLIIVPSSLRALQDLARIHLSGMPAYRIGITGSNGKTTTKEIIHSILSEEAPTAVSEGNLNSDIGLPLAVFQVERRHRFAVFEMGMNRPGEMDELVAIVRPQSALITNVGAAHIGALGSREAIAMEKKKILSSVTKAGQAWLYENEPFLDLLRSGYERVVRLYGETSTAGFGGWQERGLGGSTIRWDGREILFPLPGRHNVINALGAISLCAGLGASKASIGAGLQATKPLFGRSQILRGKITLIQDCYNANPDSMQAALDFLAACAWSGRKIVVLGSMKELGGESLAAHEELGAALARLAPAAAFLLGEEMEAAAQALLRSGYEGRCVVSVDFKTIADELAAFIKDGDLVLVKGSRSMALERVADIIAAV